jgi:predicted metal-dependent phosphoesterase TrpH
VIDLHLHTHHSDGTWSPRELVEHAVKIGMKHIAVSDHDTVSGVTEAVAAAANRLEIIPAIELNTLYQDEHGARHDVHILGYFIDIESAELLDVITRQKQARAEHVLECIELISASGVPINLALVQECAGVGAVGKAHITEAIVRAGGAGDLTTAYEKYMVRGSSFYAQRRSITPFEAVRAIRAAGGLASIAHPGKEAHVIPLIESLRDSGLGAVEAFHRVHGPQLRRDYVDFAVRHNLVVTGGSDCHGPYQEYPSMMGDIALPSELLPNLRKAHAALWR